MGGLGSGRPRRKTPVEDCLVLAAGDLQRKKIVRAGLWTSGSLIWTDNFTREKVSSVGYELNTFGAAPWLRLHYTVRAESEDMDYRIDLTTTPLPWGGVRWAFLCPARFCSRVCRKLYLPPGGRYFACRKCYDLTYKSAQDAHNSFEKLLRSLL